LPDFGALGLRLGDLGVAFWREKFTGKVAYAFFCYGDKGPANLLGEGSVLLAKNLLINPSPTGGGYTTKEILRMGKGSRISCSQAQQTYRCAKGYPPPIAQRMTW
jgi:hypothetical protein